MTDIATAIVSPVVAETEAPESTVAPENTQDSSVVPEGGETQPEQSDDLSARFAALARKEKYIREQEERFKDQESQYKPYADLKNNAKENPLSVLEQYGLSLDDLISASLGEDKPEPTVEEQLQALRDEINKTKEEATSEAEKKKKAEEEAYQNSIDEAVKAHKESINEHLSQESQYELIKLTSSEDLVWEVTQAHYEANQEVLTPEQAASKVESYLENQVQEALKLDRFNKNKVESDETPEFTFETVPDNLEDKPKKQTLTQDLSSPAPNKPSTNGLSMEESKIKASQLLKWS